MTTSMNDNENIWMTTTMPNNIDEWQRVHMNDTNYEWHKLWMTTLMNNRNREHQTIDGQTWQWWSRAWSRTPATVAPTGDDSTAASIATKSSPPNNILDCWKYIVVLWVSLKQHHAVLKFVDSCRYFRNYRKYDQKIWHDEQFYC